MPPEPEPAPVPVPVAGEFGLNPSLFCDISKILLFNLVMNRELFALAWARVRKVIGKHRARNVPIALLVIQPSLPQ
jgi:hypothetical protein